MAVGFTAVSRDISDQAGFTLPEVLVVLALMSLLSGLLFGSVSFGVKAWERITARSAANDEILFVQEFLQRTLASVYPVFVIDDPTRGHVDFTGTETSMEFVAPTPFSRDGAGQSRFMISMSGMGDAKVLSVSSQREFGKPDTIASVRDTLLTNLNEVEFSYFGAYRRGPHEWRKSWVGAQALPDLVRIRIEFRAGDARSWPELMIAPRIDVDVACVFDPLTKSCKGR